MNKIPTLKQYREWGYKTTEEIYDSLSTIIVNKQIDIDGLRDSIDEAIHILYRLKGGVWMGEYSKCPFCKSDLPEGKHKKSCDLSNFLIKHGVS